MKKKDLGQYFTQSDVWLPQIKEFLLSTDKRAVLEPFCGKGDLLKVARDLGFDSCIGYDIDRSLNWKFNDSLTHIDKTDSIILTNPPYLAKNSAKRKSSPSYKYFENNNYVDLYLLALDRVLNSSARAVAIIPESFLQTGLFHERLYSLTVIEDKNSLALSFNDREGEIGIRCIDGVSTNNSIC